MKKLLIFAALSVVAIGAQLNDGNYSVQSDKSIWFWYPKTTITVVGGDIVDVSHDRVKKDGRLASEDEGYNNRMLKKNGTNPQIYSKDIPKNYFKADGDLANIDNVAGATDSVTHFKKQMEFLMEKAKNGETGEFTMPKKDLK